MGGITVLSLFDGISCGQLALKRAGIKVKKYYANSDGTITWWSSSITVRNGGITSAPRS